MFKFSKQFARQLVGILIYMKENKIPLEKGLQALYEHVDQNRTHTGPRHDEEGNEIFTPEEHFVELLDEIRYAWAQERDLGLANQMSLEEMIHLAVGQFDPRGREKSVLILDKLADVLTGDYASSVLSGDTLIAMRKAVLNPTEMEGLEKRLQAREYSCQVCAKTLQTGEMVSLVQRKVGSYYQPMIVCLGCGDPKYTPCAGVNCGEKLPIHKKLLSMIRQIRSIKCESCKAGKKTEIVDERPGLIEIDNGPVRPRTPVFRGEDPQVVRADAIGRIDQAIRRMAQPDQRFRTQPAPEVGQAPRRNLWADITFTRDQIDNTAATAIAGNANDTAFAGALLNNGPRGGVFIGNEMPPPPEPRPMWQLPDFDEQERRDRDED